MLKGENTIVATKVRQNNLEFLVGVFSIKQILKFTKYTKRLIVGYDGENQPIYNAEIQRAVEPGRVEKIADFLINDPDAIFPTNLVLAIPQAVIDSYTEKSDAIEILLKQTVFSEIKKPEGHVFLTIIDGQHRVRGIERAIEILESHIKEANKVLSSSPIKDLQEKLDYYSKLLKRLEEIELIVSFFIDATLEFQAMVFSTINRTQKSVPQSLVYSLFGLTANDSPQKTSLQTVLSLNGYEKSPFFNRIKLYGGSYGRNQSPPLTQATMVKSILDKICTNSRESEKDRFRPRRDLIKNINNDLCFRRYYANDQDTLIGDIMFAFFAAVKNVFRRNNQESFWEFVGTNKPTNILQTTVGYLGLLEILTDILAKEPSDEKRDKIDTYEGYLKKAVSLPFDDQQRYPFTSISKTILYYDMHLKIWPPSDGKDTRLKSLDDALKKRGGNENTANVNTV